MTDRIHSFTVVLGRDTRDDDAQGLKVAIAQLRGVIDVVPVVADGDFYVAKEQARHDLRQQLRDVLFAS